MLNLKRFSRLFLLFIALISVQSTLKAQSKKVVADKIIAVVGDRIVLLSEVRNTIDDAKRQGQQVPAGAECMIMEQAVISKVMMIQAEKDSLPVTEDEVEAELDQRIRYYVQQLGTKEALEEYAQKTIYQIKDEARESVRERKMAEAMQRSIVSNVKVTPTEVKTFFEKIPSDSLPFYESELEIGQIVLYPKASKDVDEYIVNELNNYKKQVETGISQFDRLAMQVSEDPGSKERGGAYQINRNEKTWDPAFMSAAFRLKDGEISSPFRTKFGYHIIQMVRRKGDDADVRHILRIPPIGDDEIKGSISRLDSVRSKIIAGTIGFNEAAKKYTEDDNAKFAGPFMLNQSGAPYVTIDQLDKEMVGIISKLQVGEYSQPTAYTDPQGKQAVRIVYLKSRTEPHRMNLADDYSKISEYALEEKKSITLNKWLSEKLSSYYIMLDGDLTTSCPSLQKFGSSTSATRGF